MTGPEPPERAVRGRRVRAARYALTAVMLVILSARPNIRAHAQLTATLDGGMTRVAYTGAGGVSAWSLTPGVQLLRPWSSLVGSGSYARFASGEWSVQGALTGSAFAPAVLGLRAELGGIANGTAHEDGGSSGQALGRVRLHRLGTRAGGWAGGALGRVWNGVAWQTTRWAEAGLWTRRGPLTLSGSVAPSAIGESLRFFDGTATLRFERGALDLAAFGGLRGWSRPAGAGTDAWGGATMALWLDPHVALQAGAGAYPADYGQGLPGGSYLTAGVRLATRRPGTTPVTSRELRIPGDTLRHTRLDALADRHRAVLRVVAGEADSTTFVVRVGGARAVELAGDFTTWEPVALRPRGQDTWSITLRVPSGPHRLNLRVDRGAWVVPGGVPAIADEFSGAVAMVIVP